MGRGREYNKWSKVISVPHKYRNMGGNTHELTRNVLKISDTIYRKAKWEYNSPLIALEGTIFFLPGNERNNWIKNAHLKDIMERGSICTY